MKLKYPIAPSFSTIRSWRQQLMLNGRCGTIGRQCKLTLEEENHVLRAFRALRQSGAVVDNEVMILLGNAAVQQLRNGPAIEVGLYWAKSFRKRHGIKCLRKSSTDRPPLSRLGFMLNKESLPLPEDDVKRFQAWMAEYDAVVSQPNQWGIPCIGPISREKQLGCDETPLQYVPRCRGTYNAEEIQTTFIICMFFSLFMGSFCRGR